MATKLIGIDAGGTMTKVALFDLSGAEIACERRANIMLFPHAGWTERDPDAMWRATCEATRALMERTGTAADDILAITPSGFGAGVFLVDRDGATVRPGLVSTDSRSTGLINSWRADGLDNVVKVGVQQDLWSGQTLALLGWFSRHERETVSRTHHVMLCKDFLRLRLCGDVSTDPTDGGCAGLINVETGAYAADVLQELGIGEWFGKLPPIMPSTGLTAGLNSSAASAMGLKAGTPVCRGVYDVVGCSLASGLVDNSSLGVVAGTFSINSIVGSRPLTSPYPSLQSRYPVGDLFLATIATPTSASNLEWVCKTFLGAEAERLKAQGRSIYDLCSELAESALDRETAAIFLPFLLGGPTGAPGALLGLAARDDLPTVMRSVFEGIVFAHRYDIATLLADPATPRPRVMKLAGGPSRSDVWAQMFADCLDMPVEIANGSEFGAKGAAICGAVASGVYPDVASAVSQMVKVERRFEPRPDRTATMQAGYARYLQAARGLGDLWSAVNATQVSN